MYNTHSTSICTIHTVLQNVQYTQYFNIYNTHSTSKCTIHTVLQYMIVHLCYLPTLYLLERWCVSGSVPGSNQVSPNHRYDEAVLTEREGLYFCILYCMEPHMYVHIHMHTRAHAPACTNAYTHTHTHTHTYTRVHTHMHMHTRTHTHTHAHNMHNMRTYMPLPRIKQ